MLMSCLDVLAVMEGAHHLVQHKVICRLSLTPTALTLFDPLASIAPGMDYWNGGMKYLNVQYW